MHDGEDLAIGAGRPPLIKQAVWTATVTYRHEEAIRIISVRRARHGEKARYVDAPAVRDRGLITASGLGDVEFAREIFDELQVRGHSWRGSMQGDGSYRIEIRAGAGT